MPYDLNIMQPKLPERVGTVPGINPGTPLFPTFSNPVQGAAGQPRGPQLQPQLTTQVQPVANPQLAQQGNFLSEIGKAFSSFSKALKTPGFGEVFFGNIAQALGGQETWQGRMGGVLSQLGMAGGTGQAFQQLQAGEPLNQWQQMFVTPEMRLAQYNAALEGRRVGAYEQLAGAQAAGIQPWQSKAVQDVLSELAKNATDIQKEQIQALSKLLNPPQIQTYPSGKGMETGGIFRLNKDTMEYDWSPMGTGQTKGFENQWTYGNQQAQQQYWRGIVNDARRKIASDPRMLKYGHIRMDSQGNFLGMDWLPGANSTDANDMYNKLLKEELLPAVKNPYINLPMEYVTGIPEPSPITVQLK